MGSNPGVRREPAHTAAVRKTFDTLDSLVQAGEDVRGLLAHPGWAHLSRLLEHEVSDLDSQLDGRLHEHTQYAFLHGQRRGLRTVDGLAHAVVSVADQKLEEQRAKHEGAADAVPSGAMS